MLAIKTQGTLRIHVFSEDAVLFHAPSGTLSRITRPLAHLLQGLGPEPRSIKEVLAVLPANDRHAAREVLARLVADGILHEVEG